MTDTAAASAPRPDRMLTFRSGGWVLLLTGAFTLIVLGVVLVPVLRNFSNRPPGDGRDPASYGFDLSTTTVPAETIVPAMLHRDLIPALIDPPTMPASDVEAMNAEIRGKYVVPGDLVIGVVANGDARAYPLATVVTNHTILNDTLGGRPIVVTFSPLAGCVGVFDRTIDGTPVVFGVSGLMHDSNDLLYDRRGDGTGESLWSQAGGVALAGPAAGGSLERLPAALVRWSDWVEAHPETTLPAVAEADLKRYRELSYDAYARSDDLRFPVDPEAPTDERGLKTECIVVFAGGAHRLYAYPDLADAAQDGTWRDELGGVPLAFRVTTGPTTVQVTHGETGAPIPAAYAYWFAWYAQDPGVDVARFE